MEAHGSPYEIPQSRGMPPTVQVFFAVSLVVVVFMGAISAFNSKEFHVWPASNSATVLLSGSFP